MNQACSKMEGLLPVSYLITEALCVHCDSKRRR